MKATAFEFRFRLWLILAIIFFGFWSPWIDGLGWGTRTTAWLWLGYQVSQLGIGSVSGIVIVTWLAILLAAIAAGLRVWGTAYLGAGTVNSREMKAGVVTANGPYRFVRNPLYIGTWFMVAALAVLMPVSGAAAALVLLAIFQLRLILGEEAFLAASLGEPYAAYCKAVPRLFPLLRSKVVAGGQKPSWGRALLAEIMPLGLLVSFAALSWQFNAVTLERAALVSFGLSLVVRALLPQKPEATPAT